MKTWIRRTLIATFAAAATLGGLAACGGHHPMRDGWSSASEADLAQMRGRMLDRVGRELALDEAQKARLAALADVVKAQRDALRSAGGGSDLRADLQGLVAGSQFDRAKAQALVDAKTGAARQGAPAVIAAFGDFYDSLKPEQQQKLRDWMARRGGHGWRGHRG